MVNRPVNNDSFSFNRRGIEVECSESWEVELSVVKLFLPNITHIPHCNVRQNTVDPAIVPTETETPD